MAAGSRLVPLVFVAMGLAVYFVLAPRWPVAQPVHFVLGDAAPRVTELQVRYGEATSSDAPPEWTRGATFPYAAGSAPRIVSHEPKLANGDYVVDMELLLSGDAGPHRVAVRRRVTLGGGSASIDLTTALLRDAERQVP